MSSRARAWSPGSWSQGLRPSGWWSEGWWSRGLVRAGLALVLVGFAGCATEPPATIEPEPSPEVAPPAPAPTEVRAPEERDAPAPRETQGAIAKTVTIDYPPLGAKVAIAYPEDGHLCVIVPESAQEPTECMGLDPAALVEALPEGPQRPFGAAVARMGEWSYIVMVAPAGTGIESREDIEEFIAGALKADPAGEGPAPELVPPGPDRKFELMRVGSVPVVKFRIDTPHPKGSPQRDVGTTVNYAGFGGKTAVVSFVTSPDDVDKMMPYAEATVQSLVLPPREKPERFGRPRAELEQQNTRLAITIFGPLLAIGALVFLWLARSKKAEADAEADARASARRAKDAKKKAEARDDEEAANKGDEDAPDEDGEEK